MSLFAILDLEGEVQINDKTRFNASKSFNTKDSLEIASIEIKAGLDGSFIECFNPDKNECYLDWAFDNTSIDVNSSNSDLVFSESDGVNLSTNLTGGTYTLSQYVTEVVSKLNAAGALTYSGSVSDNIVTITADGTFELKSCSVQEQLHIDLEDSGTSVESNYIEYGLKAITVTVENNESTPETASRVYFQKVYSEDGDYLFSDDSDLITHESDIMSWVADGRATFKNFHRRAQKLIMQWIDENGYTDIYGNKFKKRDLVDKEEVRQWSTFMTLRLIYESLISQTDDVFEKKAMRALDLENSARKRVILRIDTDKSGDLDIGEQMGIGSISLFRR